MAEEEYAQHGPSAKYVLLYTEDQRTVLRALDELENLDDEKQMRAIQRVRDALAWTPRPHYKQTVGLQFTVAEEGEDDQGFYCADEVELDPAVAIEAVIDQLGRTESGLGFSAVVKDGEGSREVKFEWNGGFHLEPRWDV